MSSDGLQLPNTPPPELAEDERSLGEAIGLATGIDLSSREAMNRLNELIHKDKVNAHLHRCSVIGIYLIAVSAAIMFIVVVSHHLYPELWLNGKQVADLQGFLFSGGMGAVLAAFGKNVMKSDQNSK